MTPCGNRVVDFIEHGSVDGLDTDCVGDVKSSAIPRHACRSVILGATASRKIQIARA
jgi:hypothetical protein